MPQRVSSKRKSDWQDPNAVEDHFSYDMYPTNGVLELTKLQEEMRKSLPKIKVLALLIHSKLDLGVLPENMDLIYQDLGTDELNKKKIWLENSGHVVTRDLDNMIVFKSVAAFVQEVLDTSQ